MKYAEFVVLPKVGNVVLRQKPDASLVAIVLLRGTAFRLDFLVLRRWPIFSDNEDSQEFRESRRDTIFSNGQEHKVGQKRNILTSSQQWRWWRFWRNVLQPINIAPIRCAFKSTHNTHTSNSNNITFTNKMCAKMTGYFSLSCYFLLSLFWWTTSKF